MHADIHEAIEFAEDNLSRVDALSLPRRRPRFSAATIRWIVLAVVRELPEHLSVRELREELE